MSSYYINDKTETIPFKMDLISKQIDSLKIQRLALKQKIKIIKNKNEFNDLWKDDDKD